MGNRTCLDSLKWNTRWTLTLNRTVLCSYVQGEYKSDYAVYAIYGLIMIILPYVRPRHASETIIMIIDGQNLIVFLKLLRAIQSGAEQSSLMRRQVSGRCGSKICWLSLMRVRLRKSLSIAAAAVLGLSKEINLVA